MHASHPVSLSIYTSKIRPSTQTKESGGLTDYLACRATSESVDIMSPAAAALPSAVSVVSKFSVYPDRKSSMDELRLSVSDLPMLSCHYIQKGLLFPRPPIPIRPLLSLLTRSLSRALSVFPALAGRLRTRPHDGSICISCNDAGVDFVHATAAPSLTLPLLLPPADDVPRYFKSFFALDGALSYDGHSLPLAAFQLTELGDGSVFIGCTVDHAVVDGTSFWNFFNTWAQLCRSEAAVTVPTSALPACLPDFRRNYFGDSKAVLRFPDGAGPKLTFPVDAPLRERIFHFSREAILELKSKANRPFPVCMALGSPTAEACGKQVHDRRTKAAATAAEENTMISSFQSLCAQLWISVTRARKHLAEEATTTFRMAMNCRHRVVPRVDPFYFGNALQSVPTTAPVGEVASRGLRWAAGLLHCSVAAYGEEKIRRVVEEWEAAPRCFPLGNPDGAGITMGSSPRFPMYEGNDFGWGLPLAVRSGRANKFDGKISAFPGREGGGSVQLEVCLPPETMAALLADQDFMQYVSEPPASSPHN